MVSKLGKVLQDLGETYTFNGEDFILKTLTGSSMGLFEKSGEKDKDVPFKIVHASLIRTYDDITLDEVKALPIGHITKMVQIVMNVSGFDIEEATK